MSDIDQFSKKYMDEHAIQIARVVLAAAMMDDLISTFISDFLGLEEYQENALLRPMGRATLRERYNVVSTVAGLG